MGQKINGSVKHVIGCTFIAIMLSSLLSDSFYQGKIKNPPSASQLSSSPISLQQIVRPENLGTKYFSSNVLQLFQSVIPEFNFTTPFIAYKNCKAFFVNAHLRNTIYALPTIHAP